MKKEELKEIINYLTKKDIISEIELKYELLKKDPNIEKNYRFLLSSLYRNNIIYRYDTGLLKPCKDKKDFMFTMPLDKNIKNSLESIEPSIFISTWQLVDLNKYMSLQSFYNIVFIETYSYAIDIVLNKLLEIGVKAVFEKDYTTYIRYNNFEKLYVIRKINDESPIIRQGVSNAGRQNMYSYVVPPKIEKIIVDIIVDDLFDVLLADETSKILRDLLSNYKINMATIKRYATKRHNWAGVKFAIESIGFNIEEGEF